MPPPTGAPIVANKFRVDIDGVSLYFAELDGITTEVESIEFYSNGQGTPVGGGPNLSRIPGKYKPATITLKRGQDENKALWAWHQALCEGNLSVAEKTGTLAILDAKGDPQASYSFEKAWCSKLVVGGVKSGGNEVLQETATIVCTDLVRTS
jgi:phage tail-like protein